jgi:uncharacterized protein
LVNISTKEKKFIGVVYLLPSRGYELCPGLESAYRYAFDQVKILSDLGFDGALLENENDRPYKIKVDTDVMNFTSEICLRIRNDFPHFNLGLEFLINDPEASLQVAKKCGFDFIRTDYYVDEMYREEYGVLKLDVDYFNRYRQDIEAQKIKVYTDIQVKYAKMISPRPLSESALLAQLKKSDGVIVSSNRTGLAPEINELIQVFNSKLSIPIMIGSGFNLVDGKVLLKYADGAFIGQALMVDGVIRRSKAQELIRAFR